MGQLNGAGFATRHVRRPAVDQRSEQRVACRKLIALLPCDGAEESGLRRVRLVDCSPHGIGVIAAQPLRPGQRVIAATRRQHILLIVYTVLHCTLLPDGRYRIGAAVAELLGSQHEDLGAAFRALLSARDPR